MYTLYTEFDLVLCHCVDLHNATTRRTVARGHVRKNWFSQQRLNIRLIRYVCRDVTDNVARAIAVTGHAWVCVGKQLCSDFNVEYTLCGGRAAECQRVKILRWVNSNAGR